MGIPVRISRERPPNYSSHRSFQEILDQDVAPAPGVGILTGINRDTWHSVSFWKTSPTHKS